MPSAFNGTDLFGSGPQRFSQQPLGEYVLRNAAVNPFQAGSVPIGPLELIITLRGRLVAESEDDLWTLRDAITAQLTDPPIIASLKELNGRTWSTMSFVSFAAGDRTDRGRMVSLEYTATFVRFLTT